MVDLIGFIGNTALAFCALPQVYHTYKTGSAAGISLMFLSLWGLGELGAFVYAVLALESNVYLILNYSLNLTAIAYLGYTKIDEGKPWTIKKYLRKSPQKTDQQ